MNDNRFDSIEISERMRDFIDAMSRPADERRVVHGTRNLESRQDRRARERHEAKQAKRAA